MKKMDEGAVLCETNQCDLTGWTEVSLDGTRMSGTVNMLLFTRTTNVNLWKGRALLKSENVLTQIRHCSVLYSHSRKLN